MKVEPSWWDSCLYKQSQERQSFSLPLSLSLCHGRIEQAGVICKPERGLAPEPYHACTLVLNLKLPELWEINGWCLSHLLSDILANFAFKLFFFILMKFRAAITLNSTGSSRSAYNKKSKEWKLSFISHAHDGNGSLKCCVANNSEASLRFSRKRPGID